MLLLVMFIMSSLACIVIGNVYMSSHDCVVIGNVTHVKPCLCYYWQCLSCQVIPVVLLLILFMSSHVFVVIGNVYHVKPCLCCYRLLYQTMQ